MTWSANKVVNDWALNVYILFSVQRIKYTTTLLLYIPLDLSICCFYILYFLVYNLVYYWTATVFFYLLCIIHVVSKWSVKFFHFLAIPLCLLCCVIVAAAAVFLAAEFGCCLANDWLFSSVEDFVLTKFSITVSITSVVSSSVLSIEKYKTILQKAVKWMNSLPFGVILLSNIMVTKTME